MQKDVLLNGIDINKINAFLGIEEEVIFMMLLNFSKTYSVIKSDIKGLDINSSELSSYIHKLKGASGNLQIEEIYNLSSYIEKNFSSEDKLAKIDELIFKMQKIVVSINMNISPLIVKNKIIFEDDKLYKLMDHLVYDIENYNFIKKDRVFDIYYSLENRIEISLLNDMIDNFDRFDYENLKDNLEKIKSAIEN